ncbi:hypothetical protein Tco_0572248 [Tanacetum coccineum]
MSTQQDIYAAGSENRPPMLNKENYVPWSSRLLRYAKSRPNGKLIYKSIMNGPYVRRMILNQESGYCVQQLMKVPILEIQEKKAKLFNEWERFTSTDGESIESYYHRFSKLMNDFKRNKHFPEKIASNLKFLKSYNRMESTCYYCSSNKGLCIRQITSVIAQPGYEYGLKIDRCGWLEAMVVQDAVGVQNVGNQNGQIIVPGITNQNPNGNGNVVAARAEGNATGNNDQGAGCCLSSDQLLIVKEEAGRNPTQAERVSIDIGVLRLIKAPVYDSNGSAEQYTELLEPIPEPQKVQQNDSNVVYAVSSVEQGGGIVEQHSTTVEERHAYHESLFHNLVAEVEKVNLVNRKMKETNTELTTELARYKNQCLTKKINALHLSSGKQITALNEKFSNLNNQLSKQKSNVSSLQKEKKRLKSDFKIREDELLDKKIQLENKIKDLDSILVKMGQSIQTMHMRSPKPDSFYHTKQKMALGYQNPFYLKETQQKQQSLYNGKVILEKHDPPAVYDSEETLELAQETKVVQDFKSLAKEADESLAKHKALELEIERLLRAVIEQFQAQLGDTKGKSKDTSCVSNTLDPLPQKLENENVELEFQVRNYEKENAHLKTAYKNLFDSINVTRAQTKMIIKSLQNKLHDMIYENAKLRAQLFEKVSEQKDTTKGTSTNTKFANQSTERKSFLQYLRNTFFVRQPNAFQSERPNFSKTRVPQKVDKMNDLSNPVTLNSVPTTKESKVVENDKVIALECLGLLILRTLGKKRVGITTKTRRPQPRSNIKNDRVPSASKSSRIKNKEVEVE